MQYYKKKTMGKYFLSFVREPFFSIRVVSSSKINNLMFKQSKYRKKLGNLRVWHCNYLNKLKYCKIISNIMQALEIYTNFLSIVLPFFLVFV